MTFISFSCSGYMLNRGGKYGPTYLVPGHRWQTFSLCNVHAVCVLCSFNTFRYLPSIPNFRVFLVTKKNSFNIWRYFCLHRVFPSLISVALFVQKPSAVYIMLFSSSSFFSISGTLILNLYIALSSIDILTTFRPLIHKHSMYFYLVCHL